MKKVSRRNVVTGAATVVGSALTSAEAQGDAVTLSDLVAADKVLGRSTTEAERQQILTQIPELQRNARLVRAHPALGNLPPSFHFHPIVPGIEVPKGKSSVKLSRGKLPAYDGNPESLAFASVADLSRLLKARKITSGALTELYLARLKKFGPRLNCVVSLLEDRAREQAERADRELAAGVWRGPLHGIPYGLKDLFAARGTRTTFGAPPYREQQIPLDATVVSRLEAAGAVLCAKLSMGELAMGDVWFGGVTRNPWDSRRGSSGSSAGSASAVAAGLVGFALGTETLGSIVSPSRECGTTGLRPTFGRISRHGAMALSWTMDKVGPICRGVEDCALIFAALHGPDGIDDSLIENVPFVWKPTSPLSALRVGVDERAFTKEGAAQKEVLAVLEKLGVTAKPISLPPYKPEYGALTGLTIDVEGAAAFAELTEQGGLPELVQQGENSWPNTFRTASLVSAVDYLQAQRLRRYLQLEMAKALQGIDVYVTPAGSGPSILYTNLTGHPTLSTRCGMSESGRPISVEFTGNLFREDAILRLAHAYERATPWHSRWPDTEKLPEAPPPLAPRRG